MARIRAVQIVVVVVAVGIFTGMSVAPVAATGVGDSVLDGDDGGVGDSVLDGDDGGVGDSVLGESNSSDNISHIDEPDLTEQEVDTNDLPEQAQVLTKILQAYPEINKVGPEDFPVGDENASLLNVCEPLALEPSDFPTGTLPGVGDLPTQFSPVALPTEVLTNEALLQLLLGIGPDPCEVFNPNNPQVDPTDMPDEPRGQFDIRRMGQYEYNGSQGGVAVFDYETTLNESEDGPGISGMTGILVTEEFSDIDQRLMINDGRNDFGVDSRVRDKQNDGLNSKAVLVLFDRPAGAEASCDEFDEDSLSDIIDVLNVDEIQGNNIGPCGAQLVGLPNLVSVQDVFNIWQELIEDPTPQIPEGDVIEIINET